MKAIVILNDGFEESEAIVTADILKRGGVDVIFAGLVSTVVEGARGIKIIADKRLMEINEDQYDAVILPGGPGYEGLLNSNRVINLLKKFDKESKIIAAICTAPLVLAKAGVIENKLAVVYPGLEKEIPRPRNARVIVDKNVITGRGPDSVFVFAIKLLETLSGQKAVQKVKKEMMLE